MVRKLTKPEKKSGQTLKVLTRRAAQQDLGRHCDKATWHAQGARAGPGTAPLRHLEGRAPLPELSPPPVSCLAHHRPHTGYAPPACPRDTQDTHSGLANEDDSPKKPKQLKILKCF